MPHTLRLSYPKPDDVEQRVRVRAEIPDDEWAILLDFVQYSDRLLQGEEVPAILLVQVKISGNKETGLKFMVDPMPTDGVIAMLLHRLRPFVLQSNEPTNFYAVCKILKRYIQSDQIREQIDRLHSLFSGKDFQQYVKIETYPNDEPDKRRILNSDDSFTAWLYAAEYHRNPDQKQKLAEICGTFPMEYAKGIFLVMMIDKMKAILNLAKFIRFCSSNSDQPFIFQ